MEQDPLTLRAIPEIFESALFDRGDDGTDSRVLLWDLSLPDESPNTCNFTPRVDLPPSQTVPPTHRQPQRRQIAHSGPAASEPRVRTIDVSPSEAVVSHSADRLARAIAFATKSPSDPRTLTAWGQEVGVSRGALRVWCKAAGVSARSCLDFLRVLRAVVLSGSQAWDLLSILDVVDQRSLLNLLDRGGVRELCEERPPTVDEFMLRQHFIENHRVLQAVTRQLSTSRS